MRSIGMRLRLLVAVLLLGGLALPASGAEAHGSLTTQPVLTSLAAMVADVGGRVYSAHDAAYAGDEGVPHKRELPEMVTAGDGFVVKVSFVAPSDDFHAIALTDIAPAGWDVSVSVAWTEPRAILDHTPEPEEAVYIWMGPFDAGVEFTAVYEVRVPMDADPGTYTFDGFLEYYIEPYPARSYRQAISGNGRLDVGVATGVSIVGVTREVDSAVLSGATVVLYHNSEAIASAISDKDGRYALMVSGPGAYDVVVSKEGFRAEVQPISVTEPTTYTLDFVGDRGVIPEAPGKSYVLACISLSKLDHSPLRLSTSRLLDVISAWRYPIPQN